MAIFKPTDCSPFNGTFDINANSTDLPIIFECKVDTSNTTVSGYSIEIYDNNNVRVFPSSDIVAGPVSGSVSYLSDLRKYVNDKFPSIVHIGSNVNSGLNGSYLEIPFVLPESVDKDSETAGRNQIYPREGYLKNGQTYTWKITLYQAVTKEYFPPKDGKYYDSTVASGIVLGTNEDRVHTALLDDVIDDNNESAYEIVDDLVILDKFIQPININDLYFDRDTPYTWENNGSFSDETKIEPVLFRSLVKRFDREYGYIYPTNTGEDSGFKEGVANGFMIYKSGNNPNNLTATDMIDFSVETNPTSNSTFSWIWVESKTDPSNSYWEETYYLNSDPAGSYYPLGTGFPSLSGGERILFNGFSRQAGEFYWGSQYNGIYTPSFSPTAPKEGDADQRWKIVVRWVRVPDAKTWGALLNKIVLNQSTGKNLQINSRTISGTINQTPFRFVEEEPLRLFRPNKIRLNTNTVVFRKISGDPGVSTYFGAINGRILSITSGRLGSKQLVLSQLCFNRSQNTTGIFFYPSEDDIKNSLNPDGSFTIEIEWEAYSVDYYAGVVFYNTPNVTYIRPSINININMLFKDVTNPNSSAEFNITEFNQTYNYIEHNVSFLGGVDKTRYQIKSFYKDSDYNPFSIEQNPDIAVFVNEKKINPSDPITVIGDRNFIVRAEYEQSNYIQWRSFQWLLYDSKKKIVLEKTNEKYDGEISGSFYGLESGQYYVLSLTIQTNLGKIISKDYTIYAEFEETEIPQDVVSAGFDCDTLSMVAEIGTLNTIVAPEAEEYLKSGGVPTKDSVCFYNSDGDIYKKKNDSGLYETVAVVDNGKLSILNDNSLKFKNVFNSIDIDEQTAKAPIQVPDSDLEDDDSIIAEGSFSFSENYYGTVFEIKKEDGQNDSVATISIPPALISDNDGYVKINDNINKIMIGTGKYLNIKDASGKESVEWQDRSDYYNASIYQAYTMNKDGVPELLKSTGSVVNVVNTRKAEIVDMMDFGDYKTFTNYPNGAVVLYQGKYYKALKNTYGAVPAGSGYDSTKWRALIGDPFSSNNVVKTIDWVYNEQETKQGVRTIFDTETYLHNTTAFNTIDSTIQKDVTSDDFPIQNPMDITRKDNFSDMRILSADKGADGNLLPTTDRILADKEGNVLRVHTPNRMLWVRNVPEVNSVPVVVDANLSNGKTTVKTRTQTVFIDKPCRWPKRGSKAKWKDGIYLLNPKSKGYITGEVTIGGRVVLTNETETDGTTPEYSSSGLYSQGTNSQVVIERKVMSDKDFSFKVEVSLDNFEINSQKSYCFVKNKNTKGV